MIGSPGGGRAYVVRRGGGRAYQPRVPKWGYENEADPKVMEKKIEAASSHGVNVFIFDWYWYGGRPFLEPDEKHGMGYLEAIRRVFLC